MEHEFKVGDRVFDLVLQEWGKVVHTHPGIKYPVRVILDNCKSRFYTAKGYFNESYRIPRLYHQEMAIVPKDSLERVIQVKLDGKWEPRVFIAELNGGDVLCYEAKTLEEANGHSIVLRHGEWREMPKKVKLTRAEIAEKLGIDIDQLEITD